MGVSSDFEKTTAKESKKYDLSDFSYPFKGYSALFFNSFTNLDKKKASKMSTIGMQLRGGVRRKALSDVTNSNPEDGATDGYKLKRPV